MRRRVLGHRVRVARAGRVLLTAALAGALLAAAPAQPGDDLSGRLDAALHSRALRGSRTAALVVSRSDGRVVYARDADRALIPASNQKVLTALAALATFGPTHRFPTQVWVEPELGADGVAGNLWLRGGGDPALTSEDFWRLAADLRRLGLRRVRGDLVLDDSAFDHERWHPSWGPTSARAYHAPVGALTVNYGAFSAAVRPGSSQGAPVQVALDPPTDFLRLVNRAVTGPPGARRALAVDRSAADDAELVTVSGMLPLGQEPRDVYRSVLDPARYAGAVLRMQLQGLGIAVEGQTRLGAVPDTASLLHEFEGPPLAEAVRLFVKFSNNVMGETLVKAMGAQASGQSGSWANGMPAMRSRLEALGIDTAPLTLVDGSGLSYENRVTPRALVQALEVADRSFRFGPELVAALPIAAGDGTLEERAEGAAYSLRAKTGLLTRVTGLSGYAHLADGGDVIFSVIANGFRSDAASAMAALDAFAEALVSSAVEGPQLGSAQGRN